MQFSGARWEVRRGAACLGQDTIETLTRILGLNEQTVAELMAEAAL